MTLNEKKTSHRPAICALSSGKGGVGKTLTTIRLALAAEAVGKKIMLLDGDLGLANIDVMAGLTIKKTFEDLLNGHCTFDDVIMDISPFISLIPSSSGIHTSSKFSTLSKKSLVDSFKNYKMEKDLILIDTGAGINDTVLNFHQSSDCSLIVTTPEPHALTDAYALIKVLSEELQKKNIFIIVNQVRSQDEGMRVFSRMQQVVTKFLTAEITCLGCVPWDAQIQRFVMRRSMLSSQLVQTQAGQAWTEVCSNFLAHVEAFRDQSQNSITQLFENILWPQEGYVHESTRQAL